jgi:hypothetical protein
MWDRTTERQDTERLAVPCRNFFELRTNALYFVKPRSENFGICQQKPLKMTDDKTKTKRLSFRETF